MDWYFEPYNSIRATDWYERRLGQMRERSERHVSDQEAELDLDRLKPSMSSVISAWGIYITMIAGLFLFSVLYSPNVYEMDAIDLSEAIQGDGGADIQTGRSSGFRP